MEIQVTHSGCYRDTSDYGVFETFMAVLQRTGADTDPCIPRVVSKSDSIHGTATMAIEPLC